MVYGLHYSVISLLVSDAAGLSVVCFWGGNKSTLQLSDIPAVHVSCFQRKSVLLELISITFRSSPSPGHVCTLWSDLNSINFITKASATVFSVCLTLSLSLEFLSSFLLLSVSLSLCVFLLSWHLVCLSRNLLTQLWSHSQTFTLTHTQAIDFTQLKFCCKRFIYQTNLLYFWKDAKMYIFSAHTVHLDMKVMTWCSPKSLPIPVKFCSDKMAVSSITQ